MTDEDVCSFCRQPLSRARAYFPGVDATICDACVFAFMQILTDNMVPLCKAKKSDRKIIFMESWKERGNGNYR